MIDNSNKLPSKDILEKINGIAFRKSDDFSKYSDSSKIILQNKVA